MDVKTVYPPTNIVCGGYNNEKLYEAYKIIMDEPLATIDDCPKYKRQITLGSNSKSNP